MYLQSISLCDSLLLTPLPNIEIRDYRASRSQRFIKATYLSLTIILFKLNLDRLHSKTTLYRCIRYASIPDMGDSWKLLDRQRGPLESYATCSCSTTISAKHRLWLSFVKLIILGPITWQSYILPVHGFH
ncbi:hypothetical protein BDR03DRAFT_374806 [Suillus americanus]|nr:hypothetical protein BDR03DRAFT_374806 [Suillus americanus]